MRIAVPAEQAPGEARVAVSPETVKAYLRKGFEVAVETGAGRGSFIPDAQFAAAGAAIAPNAEAALRGRAKAPPRHRADFESAYAAEDIHRLTKVRPM